MIEGLYVLILNRSKLYYIHFQPHCSGVYWIQHIGVYLTTIAFHIYTHEIWWFRLTKEYSFLFKGVQNLALNFLLFFKDKFSSHDFLSLILWFFFLSNFFFHSIFYWIFSGYFKPNFFLFNFHSNLEENFLAQYYSLVVRCWLTQICVWRVFSCSWLVKESFQSNFRLFVFVSDSIWLNWQLWRFPYLPFLWE